MQQLRARHHRGLRRGLVLAGVCVAALFVAGTPRSGEARGGGAQPRPSNPNQVMGGRLFDQCIRWVARGQRGIARTTDFHIRVLAELELDTARHRGPMRIWWKYPDKYRQELTTKGKTTTKILNGEFMWIVHPNGSVQRMHGTAEGARAIRQVKEDRSRMSDLAQFITLQSLKGPTVKFDFIGPKRGTGSYAGDWLKLTRRAPGSSSMHFWLAYDRTGEGKYLAKWPGIVRIEGDARQKIPTEDFILKSWTDSPPNQPRAFRYPKFIEAYSLMPRQRPVRFLKATVEDIKINTRIPDSRFRPPVSRRR